MGRLISLRILCLALLAILGAALAAAPQMRGVPAISDVRLEVFVLSGGSLADLCQHDEHRHPHADHCALCHLITGCALPPADLRPLAIEQRAAAAIVLPQIQRTASHPRDPATPLRGPPACQA